MVGLPSAPAPSPFTSQGEQFKLVDDWMKVEDFALLQAWLQQHPFTPVRSELDGLCVAQRDDTAFAGSYRRETRNWDLASPPPFRGTGFFAERERLDPRYRNTSSHPKGSSGRAAHRNYPTGTPVDLFFDALARLLDDPWFATPWSRVGALPYVYPRGTRLKWHTDSSDESTAAFDETTISYVFFWNDEWRSTYGGELLISHQPWLSRLGGSWSARPETEALRKTGGQGVFLAPFPNRLIVLRGVYPHSTTLIHPSAGEWSRCSIAGFFR
ncbi:MAG: 2OG-Fe(II) oxygenase [Myxococcota bacterium]